MHNNVPFYLFDCTTFYVNASTGTHQMFPLVIWKIVVTKNFLVSFWQKVILRVTDL